MIRLLTFQENPIESIPKERYSPIFLPYKQTKEMEGKWFSIVNNKLYVGWGTNKECLQLYNSSNGEYLKDIFYVAETNQFDFKSKYEIGTPLTIINGFLCPFKSVQNEYFIFGTVVKPIKNNILCFERYILNAGTNKKIPDEKLQSKPKRRFLNIPNNLNEVK